MTNFQNLTNLADKWADQLIARSNEQRRIEEAKKTAHSVYGLSPDVLLSFVSQELKTPNNGSRVL